MNQWRRERIAEMVNKNNTITNEEIMQTFGVSIETVRRDLAYLEERGLLERVYGGAVKKKFMSVEPKYASRESVNNGEKKEIALVAESMILENETVFFDLGTTVLLIANLLNEEKNITAFTNSLRTAMCLADKNQNVIMPGGKVRGMEYAVSGSISEDCMLNFNIDKAFIGAGGINENGITDFIIDEARLRSKIIKNAEKVIVVADFSKMGIKAPCKVCELSDIDVLITDEKAPKELLKKISKIGVEVIVVKTP